MSKNNNIQPGMLFAVTQGIHFGANIVCIKTNESQINFLNVNDMTNMDIPRSDVLTGIESGVIELLESIPDDIMDICNKQYEKNINN